jgi:hypothetical protein
MPCTGVQGWEGTNRQPEPGLSSSGKKYNFLPLEKWMMAMAQLSESADSDE